MREHVWVKHTNCTNGFCPICQGGLSICAVCNLIEGSLTTECPGVFSYDEHGQKVYHGEEDFVNGQWIPGCSIHSPAYYRMKEIKI